MGGPIAQGLSLESSSTAHARRATSERSDFITGKRLLVRSVKRSGLEVDGKSVGLKRSAGVTGEGEQTVRRWDWQGGEQRSGDYVPHFLHPSVHAQ